jgi:acetyl esterase/lipase
VNRIPSIGLLGLFVLSLLWAGPSRSASAAPQVEVERRIVYAEPDGTPLRMNAWIPADGKAHPAVITLHGGGWAFGGLAGTSQQAKELAMQGFSAFTVQYRLAPQYTYPAQLEDVQAAVRFVRENADRFRVDPNRIGALGTSAGGHLVGLLATVGEGSLDSGSRIRVGVSMSGPMDLHLEAEDDPSGRVGEIVTRFLGCSYQQCPDKWAEASPVTHVDPTDAPMFLSGATQDPVPVQGGEEMAQKLKAAGVPTELAVVQASCHADKCQNLRFRGSDQTVLAASIAFLDKWLSAPSAPSPSPSRSASGPPSTSGGSSGRRGGVGTTAIVAIIAGAIVLAGLLSVLLRRRS